MLFFLLAEKHFLAVFLILSVERLPTFCIISVLFVSENSFELSNQQIFKDIT